MALLPIHSVHAKCSAHSKVMLPFQENTKKVKKKKIPNIPKLMVSCSIKTQNLTLLFP